ncbi:hypothetical protein PoB_007511000 [Plakobranchus ocellatus]|uniref:Uncharacterized protein n=1 Tax=Plakobranchus ocellatus TaxID=259542 RepID=A0AAV4DX63_9GAST|nr:hypothetical protein PoB_007511000 [Plakobranchus ocellatus]
MLIVCPFQNDLRQDPWQAMVTSDGGLEPDHIEYKAGSLAILPPMPLRFIWTKCLSHLGAGEYERLGVDNVSLLYDVYGIINGGEKMIMTLNFAPLPATFGTSLCLPARQRIAVGWIYDLCGLKPYPEVMCILPMFLLCSNYNADRVTMSPSSNPS